jgi:hypothetical protein
MSSALIIGFDPHAVPGMNGDAMRAVLDQELARRHAPQAAIAFNTSGGDSVEAAQRWL